MNKYALKAGIDEDGKKPVVRWATIQYNSHKYKHF